MSNYITPEKRILTDVASLAELERVGAPDQVAMDYLEKTLLERVSEERGGADTQGLSDIESQALKERILKQARLTPQIGIRAIDGDLDGIDCLE